MAGPIWGAEGTDFSVTSAVADRVELCLFDAHGGERRVTMDRDGDRWRTFAPGVGPGQRYGYRVHGPWDPAAGHRCNPHKLLLDPYARAIAGPLRWHDRLVAHRGGAYLVRDDRDSAPVAPRSIVVDEAFDWRGDRPPDTPLARTVVYEAHVKGLTRLHPAVPEAQRGTWAGVAHPAVIEHLHALGVTALELLPVHAAADGRDLVRHGLVNYWGYATVGFFAPRPELGHGDPADGPRQLKEMVRALHDAGIAVWLDVVFNHTGEGDHDGATWCFKGLDNAAYYRLAEDRTRYVDVTGTGNTFDAGSPVVQALILDSLRHWAEAYHIDGFRFDLAPTLLRGPAGPGFPARGGPLGPVDLASPLLAAIDADPALRGRVRVAEPWDLGPDGYRAGGFPPGWSEWNDRFRDDVRDFWRGRDGTVGDLARRLTGSADRFAARRPPTASVNFVACHDGFTLRDLVSYERKHNLANGEGNRDGSDTNRSSNFGHEGPTDDPRILEARARQQRNLFATLALSIGVPMFAAGDELGRTQRGNNNAYCQDGPVSWLDWARADAELLSFCREVLAIRRAHPTLTRADWLVDDPAHSVWFAPTGQRMTIADWEDPTARTLGWLLRDGGRGITPPLLILLHAGVAPVRFVLPDATYGAAWQGVLDTAGSAPERRAAGEGTTLAPRSLRVLQPYDPTSARSA